MNPTVTPLEDAVGVVRAGATVGIGGSITTRKPVALVQAIAASGVGDLHLVSFTGSIGIDLLVGAGAVRAVSAAYVGLGHFGRAPHFVAAAESAAIEDLEYSEWLLLQRIRAAAMGVAFLPSRAAIDSELQELHHFKRITDPYSGDELLALPPLRLDVALIHAWRASADGYVQFADPPDHLWDIDVAMAKAADTVIVSVDEIVSPEAVRQRADLTKLFPVNVDAIVEIPGGSWPTASRPGYSEDAAALRNYAAEGVLAR
jgi:glutaconate CoA-transferase subunit A